MAVDVAGGLSLISDAAGAVLAVGLAVFGVFVASFIYDSLTKTVNDDDQDAPIDQTYIDNEGIRRRVSDDLEFVDPDDMESIDRRFWSHDEANETGFAETEIDPGAFAVTCRACLEESTASNWHEVMPDDDAFAVGDMDDEEFDAAGQARYECPLCGAHQEFPE